MPSPKDTARMHSLPRPVTSGAKSFATAVATIRAATDQLPYSTATSAIIDCCIHFDHLAENGELHLAQPSRFVVKGLSNAEMVKLYEQQFLQNKGTETIRNSIRNAPQNGLCPYCGEGSVHELDHYLPKRTFTATTVHPTNLVPACRDCNRVKNEFFPTADSPAVIHPYFDSAFDSQWLYASLIQRSNGQPTAEFEVRLPMVDLVLQSRLESHMKVFHLYDRFRVLASQALNNFERLMRSDLGSTMNLAATRNHLTFTAFQQSGGRENSWERAVFEAMANDDWYLQTYLGLS